MISIVVPIYNEAENLRRLHASIVRALRDEPRPFEIIFVDDGSTDVSVDVANSLKPLTLIRLQRNYGQTAAIDTGIFHASGEIIVLLDADMQNDPRDIPRFLAKLEDGFDAVIGWRKARSDHWTRVAFSRVANTIARNMLGLHIHDFGCGLKAYRSSFIKDFRLWGEAQVFLPAVAHQRGARIAELSVEHYAREFGSAKVSILKMIRGGFDLVAIAFFVRYMARPMRFFGGAGLVSGLFAITAFTAAILLRISDVRNLSDTPLPIVGTLFTILGVLLFMIGFLAEMSLRMHYAITNTSPYFVREVRKKT